MGKGDRLCHAAVGVINVPMNNSSVFTNTTHEEEGGLTNRTGTCSIVLDPVSLTIVHSLLTSLTRHDCKRNRRWIVGVLPDDQGVPEEARLVPLLQHRAGLVVVGERLGNAIQVLC